MDIDIVLRRVNNAVTQDLLCLFSISFINIVEQGATFQPLSSHLNIVYSDHILTIPYLQELFNIVSSTDVHHNYVLCV